MLKLFSRGKGRLIRCSELLRKTRIDLTGFFSPKNLAEKNEREGKKKRGQRPGGKVGCVCF